MTSDPSRPFLGPALLADLYAPITSSVGFIESPLETVAQALVDWRGALYGPAKVEVEHLDIPFPATLERLEPLTGGTPPRELLVATDSPWTAYFDCFIQGPDPAPPVGHLAELLLCRAVTVCSIRHTWSKVKGGRIGSVQFQMFGPVRGEFLNYVRTVEATHDGRKWQFFQSGTRQDFEHPEHYSHKSIQQRFPSTLLDEYCRALGIRYFDSDYYAPRAVLIESQVPIAPSAYVMSLHDAQEWLGIATR